ncbi:MAG: sterol desaturase/sphingolipid hydroxylase (fatty acid hydroxylase superfamily) [Planctomycetota bacterium]|jgi:sterol desaturase/sphingolipid hydroxylase (fatty acid hydroxylase superfamily)
MVINSMLTYWIWLVGISLGFALLERLRPARSNQAALRPQLLNDLFYLGFNGHWWALITGGVIGSIAIQTRELLVSVSLAPETALLTDAPFAIQFIAYFIVVDFLQWWIHRLLHTVPLLWQFHKVHHSIHSMDWAGNFRFHFVELIVYRSLLFVPLFWLGGANEPLFVVAVFGTAWGHFNHSNLNIGIGPLAYIFNSPRMHLWHHDSSSEGGVAKNFGIVLSCWDYIFRTAFWPKDRAPERIGFPGDEEIPVDIPRQMLFPTMRTKASGNES